MLPMRSQCRILSIFIFNEYEYLFTLFYLYYLRWEEFRNVKLYFILIFLIDQSAVAALAAP